MYLTARRFWMSLTLLCVLVLPLLNACKQIKPTGTDATTESVPACTVWPEHFMVTKGNIPVFESPEDLEDNREAKYVGKNTPVIRELTILNEEKNAKLMKIIVRGGSLAGNKRWWTLASHLQTRTQAKCPENTPRKCSENAVHFCDGSGCRCIEAGNAPDDPYGNFAIETLASLGLGSVKSLGYLFITRIGAVKVVPAAVASMPTHFVSEAIDLTAHVAKPQTLKVAEDFVSNEAMHSFKIAGEVLKNKRYFLKLDKTEIASINYYTGMGYGTINAALRKGDTIALKKFQPVIEAISSGLTKMSEKAYSGVVYRGVSLSNEVLALYKPGSFITEKAFTSTSRAAAESFRGNTLFKILSNTGRQIDEISSFPGEAEVLFPPGTVFKVISKKLEDVYGRKVTTIYMQQVGQ